MSQEGLRRLQKEYQNILKTPVPNAIVVPDPGNWFHWHYVIYELWDSPYVGGVYHGELRFPRTYPFAPPSIIMHTSSGRFETE